MSTYYLAALIAYRKCKWENQVKNCLKFREGGRGST
jgi:hypothetical protein